MGVKGSLSSEGSSGTTKPWPGRAGGAMGNQGELCSPDSGHFPGEKTLPLEKGELLFLSPLFLLEEPLTCFVSARGDRHLPCRLHDAAPNTV